MELLYNESYTNILVIWWSTLVEWHFPKGKLLTKLWVQVIITISLTYYRDIGLAVSIKEQTHQLSTKYYRDIDVAVCIKEFHHSKGIKLIVIITYYFDLFDSFPLGSMLFHQLLRTHYRDIGVAVIIKKFHYVEDIILE